MFKVTYKFNHIHPSVKQLGFTLVELMVTIAVVAILAMLAAPSFTGIMANTALDGHATALMEDMRFARSEAVRHGTSVAICASSNADQVTPTCLPAASATWSTGWIVFVDTNADGDFTGVDELVRRQAALDNTGPMDTGTGGSSGKPPRSFRFTADGRAAGSIEGSIILKPSNADSSLERAVCVNSTGRPRATNKPSTTC
jgi:type IV fimbrial biogenesis protein FimT